MQTMNIYISGVGGQGIGLLSEVLLRAADHAGFRVKAVDTHGLAQRGGIVISQVRIGDRVFNPLIPRGEATLVVSLERQEALRALNLMAKEDSALIYYDTVWQPLPVRMGELPEISREQLEDRCRQRNIRLVRVQIPGLSDPRTQNIALLAELDRQGLIQGIETRHYRQAMEDLLAGNLLVKNLALFDEVQASSQ